MPKLLKPSYTIEWHTPPEYILKIIEKYGRKCYQSDGLATADSWKRFAKDKISKGHLGLAEHQIISVIYICDRGVTHELVRHRIASFLQESTRYCNYKKGKNGMQFIQMQQHFKNEKSIKIWLDTIHYLEEQYNKLIEFGEKPEIARCILPNNLKAEIVETANLREWKYQLELRTRSNCHPQMRELMIPLHKELKSILPEIF